MQILNETSASNYMCILYLFLTPEIMFSASCCRIVAIPLAYRCEQGEPGVTDGPYLFAHPTILNLPSNLIGQHIYSCIQRLKPGLSEFRVLLTDGTVSTVK